MKDEYLYKCGSYMSEPSIGWLIDLCPYQHDNRYMDSRSQIKVHSAQSSLVVIHPSTIWARRYLASVNESPSKHWSLSGTSSEPSNPKVSEIFPKTCFSNRKCFSNQPSFHVSLTFGICLLCYTSNRKLNF